MRWNSIVSPAWTVVIAVLALIASACGTETQARDESSVLASLGAAGGAAPAAEPTNDLDDDPLSDDDPSDDQDSVSDECAESTSTSDSVSNPDSVSNNDGVDDDADGEVDEDSESDLVDSESSMDVGCGTPDEPPPTDTAPGNPV